MARWGGGPESFGAGDAVKDDGFLHSAGTAAESAIITCPCQPPERASGLFVHGYRARFHHEPGTYSAEAYDAATVLLRAVEAGNVRRRDVESFVDRYAANGITAPIRFTETGELVDSSVAVWAYRVRDGAIVADQPIPRM
jgi:branched-chain amino acid transport system substrate-binding protein